MITETEHGAPRSRDRRQLCRVLGRALLAPIVLASLGCDGPQSALAPAGRGAAQLADLFWLMTGGTAVVWFLVVALALYAVYFARAPHSAKAVDRLVVIAGAVIPTIVVSALLVHGLSILPDLLAPAARGARTIEVAGEQWWWRVRYLDVDGEAVESANEIRLPVGAPVELRLETRDVIHSLWIPALAGKVDMIPGRWTRLRLEPSHVGTFRGVCAEYCGTSHAWMAFPVVVEEREDFDRWLARQAGPAVTPSDARAQQGATLFVENGCGACHRVRGTVADGVIGPDLTHVGSRLSIGAGRLDAEPAAFSRWLADPDALKPAVHMPAYGMLPPDELGALAAYLESLR